MSKMIGAMKKPQTCPGGQRVHRATNKKPTSGLHSYEFRSAVLRAADKILNPTNFKP